MEAGSAVRSVRTAARKVRGSMTPATDSMLRLGVRKVRHDRRDLGSRPPTESRRRGSAVPHPVQRVPHQVLRAPLASKPRGTNPMTKPACRKSRGS